MWKSILKHSNCDLPNWIKVGKPIDITIMTANICNGCSYTLIACANIVNVYQDLFDVFIPPKPTDSKLSDSQWAIENPQSYLRRQCATIMVTCTFLVPMTFVNLRKVSWVSILGILATALLCFVVAFCFCTTTINLKPEQQWELWNPSYETIGCFAQFSIAVCAHSISPNFYQALEKRSPSRFVKTTSFGYLIILIMNLTVAIFGYLTFGKQIGGQANILEAYSKRTSESSLNRGLINVARVKYILSCSEKYRH